MIAGTSTTLFVSLCLYICLFLFVFCLFLFVCIFVTCISWVGDCISVRMWAKLTISTKQSNYSWSTKFSNEPDSSVTKEFNNFYQLQKLDFLRCQKQAECSSSYFLKKVGCTLPSLQKPSFQDCEFRNIFRGLFTSLTAEPTQICQRQLFVPLLILWYFKLGHKKSLNRLNYSEGGVFDVGATLYVVKHIWVPQTSTSAHSETSWPFKFKY